MDAFGPEDPLITAMSVFRSRWDPLILGASLAGVCRFGAYRRTLGISTKTLTDRLAYLVSQGLLSRESYQDRPTRHEYLLTAKGRDLLPTFQAMAIWAGRWHSLDRSPDRP